MRSIEQLVAEGAAKPAKRRVDARLFMADGTEVFITQICTRCHAAKPLKAFGLRRMDDGKVRSIPQCKACRTTPSVPVRIETRARI